MMIGERLREIREGKKLSQGDIEKRTGLLRCYVSRAEDGHTVPALETLEKNGPRTRSLPLYQLFYEGEEPPKVPNLLKRKVSDDTAWGNTGKEARYLNTWARSSRIHVTTRVLEGSLPRKKPYRQSARGKSGVVVVEFKKPQAGWRNGSPCLGRSGCI